MIENYKELRKHKAGRECPIAGCVRVCVRVCMCAHVHTYKKGLKEVRCLLPAEDVRREG